MTAAEAMRTIREREEELRQLREVIVDLQNQVCDLTVGPTVLEGMLTLAGLVEDVNGRLSDAGMGQFFNHTEQVPLRAALNWIEFMRGAVEALRVARGEP